MCEVFGIAILNEHSVRNSKMIKNRATVFSFQLCASLNIAAGELERAVVASISSTASAGLKVVEEFGEQQSEECHLKQPVRPIGQLRFA